MRGFQSDAQPSPGWGVDWKIAGPREVHLRYTDLTRGAEAMTAESWTVASATSSTEYWIPTVISRRRAGAGELKSTFVGVMEPYEGQSLLRRVTRLDREGEAAVRVAVELANGWRDLITSSAESMTWERQDGGGQCDC